MAPEKFIQEKENSLLVQGGINNSSLFENETDEGNMTMPGKLL